MPEGTDFFKPTGTTDELAERARSEDPVVRWAALLELGDIGDYRAALAIRHALCDLDDIVYEAACTAARRLEPGMRAQVGISLTKNPGGPSRVTIRPPGQSAVSGRRRRVPRLLADRLRPRAGRQLKQIPVDELCQVVKMLAENDPDLLRQRERAMTLLTMVYQVKEAEYPKFCALLEKNWAPLRDIFES